MKLSGRTVMAYALLLAGTLATVAGNIAHAQPNVGAKALSAVIPALLFMAFHVAAYDTRWLIRVGTSVVAGLCFGISFDHISALAVRYGESQTSSVLYPLAIDGAMIVATFVLSRSPVRPDSLPPAVLSAPLSAVRTAALSAVEDRTAGRTGPSTGGQRTNGFVRPMPAVRPKPAPADNSGRLSAAQKIADDLGDKLSRPELMKRLKKEGYTISTQAASDLTRELKAARPSSTAGR